jgi:hypothetical protein
MNATDTILATTVNDDPASLFKPFEWVPPERQSGPYYMLSDVRDLAMGVGVVLQMIEVSELQSEAGDAPLIGARDRLQLMRMSIAAMRTIEGRIDGHFWDMCGHGPKKQEFEARKDDSQ